MRATRQKLEVLEQFPFLRMDCTKAYFQEERKVGVFCLFFFDKQIGKQGLMLAQKYTPLEPKEVCHLSQKACPLEAERVPGRPCVRIILEIT